MPDITTPAVDLNAAESEVDLPPIGSRARYDVLMKVIRNRVTVRKFDQDFVVPDEHFELILEAARHAPSGANAQPWHYIIVQDQTLKDKITAYFVAEQRFRAKAKMKFPTPDYRGLASAPGFIVVCSDMRWVRAFPVLKDDDSELNQMYRENAERILLQSVAASTMSAHLAAAALGYNVWWVSAIGQENAQDVLKPLLGVPPELSVLDIFLFGPPATKPYKRWRKSLSDIVNREQFEARNFMTDGEIDDWIKTRRHRVMYKDASRID
jgi:5,6-dimethylbenzimidazole synthase